MDANVITNGKVADVYVNNLCQKHHRRTREARKKKNFSTFIVDKELLVSHSRQKEKKMGIKWIVSYSFDLRRLQVTRIC